MSLTPGTRLGVYHITAPIGEGGMGQVYRATDTTLGRQVAIKILPDAFASDPERLARFEREAKTLASLNHPHIAAIYGFEKSGGLHALVMELVEGEDLSQRIARGAIPIDDALPIAKQIAEALEAAHEQGIIHRDLKPANIKVRPDGTVKVLDFGLAKAVDSVTAAANVSQSPTITTPAMTQAGMILGTAAYMSPEQAKGRPADKRGDVWAFGCVLYEMLTGKRAFEGEDVSDTLAFVLTKEPDWSALPVETPGALWRLLRRSVEKDRKRRLADIADVRLEIDEALTAPSVDASGERVAARAGRNRHPLPWAVAGALLLALLFVLWPLWRTVPPPRAPLRLSAELGVDASLVTDLGAAAIVSPDGSVLAFVAQKSDGGEPRLYVRRLEQLQATLLAGTDDASSPFFSPDGQWIAFFAGGKLKKISVTGGVAVTLCEAPNGRGGIWVEDDTIVFLPDSLPGVSFLRVSSAGGRPEPLATLGEGEVTQRWPQALPGGKAVLYTSSSSVYSFDDANLVAQTLPGGDRKVVVRGGHYGRYLPSGHLVYMHDGTLFAAPFSLELLALTGPPVPALEGVFDNVSNGGAQFAVSGTGTLVYLPGQGVLNDVSISWMDHQGKTTPLRAAPANWTNPRFSPDGRRLAIDIIDKAQDVWVYDWARDTLSSLTSDPADDRTAVWTPDGRRITFSSNRADKSVFNLYWQRTDGTGQIERLTESKHSQYAASWHPTGQFLAFHEANPQTGDHLMILPMEGDEVSGWRPGKPRVFVNSPFVERQPMFSPDGRWIAYTSNQSGRTEVWVRPFAEKVMDSAAVSAPSSKWQISTGGGNDPVWSRTRRELFYRTAGRSESQIMSASYTVEDDSFRAEKPRLWSEGRFVPRPRLRSFDLHPDGERVAVALVPEQTAKQDKVVLIFNFFDELRRIAPATKR